MTRVALITGGQRGIGLCIARALAEAGYSLALASRSAEDTPAVQNAIKELRTQTSVAYYQFDVGQGGTNAATLLDQVEADLGPLSTFINNAGIGAPVRGDMLELEPSNFDLVMNVNLRGAFFLAQEAAKRLLNRGKDAPYGSIQFVSSVSADMVSIERAEYCLSKAAAAMMARLYAVRLANAGIGVFELRPGIIETDMTAGVKGKYDNLISDGLVPAGRWGYPEDIGSVVVPLAEGQFIFATGAVIPIDGGLSIHRL